MADFTGNVFVGIDADLMGDGEGDTIFVNSHAEACLRRNHIHLYEGIEVATWTPPIFNSFDQTAKGQTRPRCALEWATIAPPFWFQVYPGLTSIEIGGLMRVGDEGSGGISEAEDVLVKIELIGLAGTKREVASTLVGAGAEWNDFLWTLSILEPIETPLWTMLRIMMKSTPGANIGSSGTVVPAVRATMADSGSVYADPSGTEPNNTSHDVMCTKLTGANGEIAFVDHIYYHGSQDMMVVNPPPPGWENYTAQKVSLNYVQVAGLNFRPRYDYEETGRQAYLALPEIRPRISNTGITASKHAFNTDLLARRPRLVWVGPQGWTDGDTTNENGMGQYNETIFWPFVDGDAGAAQILEDVSVRPWRAPTNDDGASVNYGSLRVDLAFIATHLTNEFYGQFENLQASRTRVTWDVTVEILQMPSTASPTDWGDAVSLGSETRAVVFNAWPSDNSGVSPFLQQMCWSKFNDESIDYTYTFKEGMLFEADFGLLQNETFVLPISDSVESKFPVRVKISAELNATPSNIQWGFVPPGSGAAQQTSEFLRLSLVGCSGHWQTLNQTS